jgi:hypothetical protein
VEIEMNTVLSKGIKASVERETLSDGSKADNVMIRWENGFIKIAAVSQQHAEKLFMELANASHVDITTWPGTQLNTSNPHRQDGV